MKVKYNFQDGEYIEIEVSENIGNVIIEMERKADNLDRKERHHCTYYDGLPFQNAQYADNKYSPETVIEKKLNSNKLLAALDILTPTQKRRFLMYSDGMTISEIAKAESVLYMTVKKSIKYAQKKIKKYLKHC